jgi:hypothetical protein
MDKAKFNKLKRKQEKPTVEPEVKAKAEAPKKRGRPNGSAKKK